MLACALSPPAQSSNPETRIRYWNAYMLFYEAVVHPKMAAIPQRVAQVETTPISPLSPHPEDDKLSQLQVCIAHICVLHVEYTYRDKLPSTPPPPVSPSPSPPPLLHVTFVPLLPASF